MNRLHLYKDVPRKFDAWDINSIYLQQEVDGAIDICVEAAEQGAEAVLRVTSSGVAEVYHEYVGENGV